MVSSSRVPGVGVEQLPPEPDIDFSTGVLGLLNPSQQLTVGGALPPQPVAQAFASYRDFVDAFRDERGGWRTNDWRPDEFAWNAVQGFFLNGGSRCWLLSYDPSATGIPGDALDLAVAALAEVDDVDLVCAPSLLRMLDPLPLQQQLVRSCARRDDWFLILDGPAPGANVKLAQWIEALRAVNASPHLDAALYHPWVVLGADVELSPGSKVGPVPPSGHVAGIYAGTDRRVGVHKAPANEELRGVVDLAADVGNLPDGANALRALPGRGIRVWGARTLAVPAPGADANAQVNARRLVLTLRRWLVRALDWAVFEANDFRLWLRVHRELQALLTGLYQRGALRGKAPDEAFYVKCDEENNPADVRAAGKLQIDIGIAPAIPNEFIQIRLVRSAERLTVA